MLTCFMSLSTLPSVPVLSSVVMAKVAMLLVINQRVTFAVQAMKLGNPAATVVQDTSKHVHAAVADHGCSDDRQARHLV
jgi:hypothetical protein